MAKKKKTRQDKIKADLRHELPHSPLYVVSQPTEKVESTIPIVAPQATSFDLFFIRDLRRTLYLTIAILAGQLGLFLFLKNQIIKLPFISY